MRQGERLPDYKVKLVRRWKRRFGDSYRDMGYIFGVSHMTIARIVRGETYKGVK